MHTHGSLNKAIRLRSGDPADAGKLRAMIMANLGDKFYLHGGHAIGQREPIICANDPDISWKSVRPSRVTCVFISKRTNSKVERALTNWGKACDAGNRRAAAKWRASVLHWSKMTAHAWITLATDMRSMPVQSLTGSGPLENQRLIKRFADSLYR